MQLKILMRFINFQVPGYNLSIIILSYYIVLPKKIITTYKYAKIIHFNLIILAYLFYPANEDYLLKLLFLTSFISTFVL
ncbi:hypothetical protein MEPL4_5c01680 [Melissococcus plutonius]|nr:hypothetical protein MEPL_c014470 [Melissococcus plutonius S1]KMT23957.1 hypothetical protein MEPL2_3c01690 [Melissococcus plutonius]KMT24480.1 hypothetical protein MEPL3_6c01690 [Melissococcus plutonius]KMT26053.1 hypothetical protein MEPL1_6c01690 [Melissococcus plutonius]KMT28602.1 hypothetical protein MEPL4_5c01680 [Melissococcus plutonius]